MEKKQSDNQEVGRMLNNCMNQFSKRDMSLLEHMVLSNFKDAMMTNSLAKLEMSQIHLTEKISNIFSQSLNNYILH